MSEKISSDVVLKRYESTLKTLHRSNKHGKVRKAKVLSVLERSELPLNISEIRKLAGIPAWITTKETLIRLEMEGKVEHFCSGRCLLFRIKQPQTTITTLKSSVKVEEGVIWFTQGVKKLGLKQDNVKILVDKYGVEKVSELIKRGLEKKGFTSIPNDEIEKKIAIFIFEFLKSE